MNETRPCRAFFSKLVNRETVTYAVFGVATAAVNLLTYRGLLLLALDYRVSNLVALVFSKLFAYVANKRYVFRSKTESFGAFMGEFLRFAATRGATALIDYFGLILLVERFHMDEKLGKYIVIIVVVVLNYVLGKKLVFTKKAAESEPAGDADGEDGCGD